MVSLLKHIQTEPVTSSSELTAISLLTTMKNFRKDNSTFSMDIFWGNNPNLDLLTKSNFKIEISPLWQSTQIPYGMHVRLDGKIMENGNHSIIEAVLKPNWFWVALFWIILLCPISITIFILLSDDFTFSNIWTVLLSLIMINICSLLFCGYKKKKLVKDIAEAFNLRVL